MSNTKYLYDCISKKKITYTELEKHVYGADEYIPAFQAPDFIEYIKNLFVALYNDLPIVLVDNDFSENEIKKLELSFIVNEKKEVKRNISQEINKSKSVITLFTSGTTGLPKKVEHSIETLTRMVKTDIKYQNNIWGVAYNPTHMAGLQVLFQAYMNQNSIINIFGSSADLVFNAIGEHSISHISATPTFYKLLNSNSGISFTTVQRVTVGGEKSDFKLYQLLNKLFPLAVINNIYASTEVGSLLVSHNNYFKIPKSIAAFVKIDNNQLFIHKKLLTHLRLEDEWYATGDFVEFSEDDNELFKIVGRNSDMINIGGYKVNPNEVEEQILKIEGVRDVLVYGKPNSVMGYILCADVETIEGTKLEKSFITKSLKDFLQEFKIPRIITFKKIELTRTGKKLRIS